MSLVLTLNSCLFSFGILFNFTLFFTGFIALWRATAAFVPQCRDDFPYVAVCMSFPGRIPAAPYSADVTEGAKPCK